MARPLQIYNESGNGNDNCKCTQIECISYRDFPSLLQLPESYSWIERIVDRKMFTFYIKQNLKMIFLVCSQTR